ncbi:MAG: hypothetical protein ACK5IM_07470 [Demequina sp.]|uniref:hypothetical protein n=1 Tax=Demequina sp. TaxID=2050685 RepID=UPI003A86401A
MRRALAAALVTILGGAGIVVGAVAPATAADVAFSVDDFNGNSMGEMTELEDTGYECVYSDNASVTVASGTMQVSVPGEDSRGCRYASAGVKWTAPTSVNIEQGGADRLTLKYRNVTPSGPSAITFGIRAVDVNGKVAQVGGLTRNGGSGEDFLTIRYAPAYVGDVSYLQFEGGFDKSQVKSITLLMAATASSQAIGVTFEGVGSNVGEPTYQAPAIGAASEYVFDGYSSYSFDVTGYPTPTVTATGVPSWLSVVQTPGDGVVRVTLSGDPGGSGTTASVRFTATVANSLTAQATIPVGTPRISPVPSDPVTLVRGKPADLVVGTATPSSKGLSVTSASEIPAGMTISLQGNAVRFAGTPTQGPGPFSVIVMLSNGYEYAQMTVSGVITEAPDIDGPSSLSFTEGTAITPVSFTVTGDPVPTVTAEDLPPGLTLGPTGILSGTPTTPGDYDVVVRAVTPTEQAVHHVTIAVASRAQVLAPTTATWAAGTAVSMPLMRAYGATVQVTDVAPWMTLAHVGDDFVLTGTPTLPAGVNADSGTLKFVIGTGTHAVRGSLEWTVERREAPQLSVASTASVVAGQRVAIDVSATGYPVPTITLVNAPSWLTYDAGRGQLVGTPPTAGTFSVDLSAGNGVGADATSTVTISVAAPAGAVSLGVSQAEQGKSFMVSATGFAPYDKVEVWLHSTPVLLGSATADTTGALSLRVTIPANTPAGQHTVVVKASSGASVSTAFRVLADDSSTPQPTVSPSPIDPGTVTPTPTPDPTATPEPTSAPGGDEGTDAEAAGGDNGGEGDGDAGTGSAATEGGAGLSGTGPVGTGVLVLLASALVVLGVAGVKRRNA